VCYQNKNDLLIKHNATAFKDVLKSCTVHLKERQKRFVQKLQYFISKEETSKHTLSAVSSHLAILIREGSLRQIKEVVEQLAISDPAILEFGESSGAEELVRMMRVEQGSPKGWNLLHFALFQG